MTIDLKHITVAFDYTSGDIADRNADGCGKEPVRSGDHRQDGPV